MKKALCTFWLLIVSVVSIHAQLPTSLAGFTLGQHIDKVMAKINRDYYIITSVKGVYCLQPKSGTIVHEGIEWNGISLSTNIQGQIYNISLSRLINVSFKQQGDDLLDDHNKILKTLARKYRQYYVQPVYENIDLYFQQNHHTYMLSHYIEGDLFNLTLGIFDERYRPNKQ